MGKRETRDATTWVALLRGVNLGNRRLAMAELAALFETLGFAGAKTLLQSGNVVFRAAGSAAGLERRLAAETEARFGLATTYLLRSADEWRAIVAANPFPREAAEDPARTVLHTLQTEPSPDQLAALGRANPGDEKLRAIGRALYAYYPRGQAETKLTAILIDRHLGGVSTGRNWNTVLKLERLVDAFGGGA
jgi:uncharacterized protein (DUF1697 family)